MGRSPCCDKDGMKKGPWLPEEDQKLIDYIQKHGPANWRTLPKKAGLQRCGKSCRLRWTNYLRPDIKRGRFSFEEEEAIIQLHSILGNKWSAIAAKLPGRTDNEIKNYWNTHIKKRMLKMGIDPITHTRRLDLRDISSIFNQSLQNSQLNLLQLLALVNPDQLLKLNYLLQNLQETQNSNVQIMKNLFNPIGQIITTNQIQIQPNLDQEYHTNISGFNAQNLGTQFNDQLGRNILHDSDKSNQSLSFSSSQQQTTLSSNSGYNTNNNSSIGSQEEIDSYCDTLINFDIPLDVFNGCTSS